MTVTDHKVQHVSIPVICGLDVLGVCGEKEFHEAQALEGRVK